ncbi:MAG: TetR/AcrR family transcriptional regulator [Nocardioidaceae bacterium]
MARRQARFTPHDLDGAPKLQDESPELWNEQLGEVARGLLTSAVRCFDANGYHGTTTRDITVCVGLSPAALYVHFPSKELVLYEIIRTSHERALTWVRDTSVDDAIGPTGTLRAMVSRYTAWHARHHVAARVSQYELAGLTAEHHDEIMQLRHQTNDVFRGAVARGIDAETFAQIDVNRVVRAILSLSIDLVRWYRLDGKDSPEELGEFYAELALKMVSPTPAPATTHKTQRNRASAGRSQTVSRAKPTANG